LYAANPRNAAKFSCKRLLIDFILISLPIIHNKNGMIKKIIPLRNNKSRMTESISGLSGEKMLLLISAKVVLEKINTMTSEAIKRLKIKSIVLEMRTNLDGLSFGILSLIYSGAFLYTGII
jgi:hypothetical protein